MLTRPPRNAPGAAIPPPPRADRTGLGLALMVCFAAFGPVIDALAKLVPAHVPIAEIATARFAVQAVLLLPLAALFGGLHLPGLREALWHLARAALILAATALFFTAIRVMPLADAIAIFFIEPFILTLLGRLFLGEPVGARRIIACLVGFGGALLVIQPSFSDFGAVALLPAATAGCFALYMVLTRAMARSMNPIALQAHTALAAVVLALPVLAAGEALAIPMIDPVWPEARTLWLLLGVGLSGAVAHLFISFALSHAPAATLAPLQYLEIVSATVLGYTLFGDLPDGLTLAGIAVIVGSGLYVFRRERALGRAIGATP